MSDAPPTAPFRGRKLRLAIAAGTRRVPAWLRDLVATVKSHPALEVTLLDARVTIASAGENDSLLHAWFRRWDERRAVAQGAPVDDFALDDCLRDVAVLTPDQQADVVWSIGAWPPDRELAGRAVYGVWGYARGDGFRAAFERSPTTGASLGAMRADGTQHVLGRSEVRTHPTSAAINEWRVGMSGQRLLIEALDRLIANGWSPSEFLARHSAAQATAPMLRPTNAQMVSFAARVLLPSALRTRREAVTRWRWRVGVAARNEDDAIGRIRSAEAAWLTPAGDKFLADPFLWQREGRGHVFVEEFVEATGRGHISVASWSATDGFGHLTPALVENTHLSYPFLFEQEGRVLMMPERHMGGALWAYASEAFPLRWQKHRLVFDLWPCVDATLLEADGRWWLFCSRVTGEISEDNLHAFHAASPFGPWVPHTLNPLREGLRSSRMAGGFFHRKDGTLVRPSQDCSACYGGALVFHEVQELTPTSFRENEIAVTTACDFPQPWNERVHTFDATNEFVAFDACRRFTHKDA